MSIKSSFFDIEIDLNLIHFEWRTRNHMHLNDTISGVYRLEEKGASSFRKTKNSFPLIRTSQYSISITPENARVFQENKARQIFQKTDISYPLIRTRRCAYQGVRNVHFFGKFGVLWFSWNTRFQISPFAILPTNWLKWFLFLEKSCSMVFGEKVNQNKFFEFYKKSMH